MIQQSDVHLNPITSVELGTERTNVTDIPPQEQVAALFMKHKGYSGLGPYHQEKLDGQPCWYFYYDLPEGILELEVSWDGAEWDAYVTTFTLHRDK